MKALRQRLAAAFALAIVVGCAPRGLSPSAELGEGLMSFYGKGFDGKLTASGERFDSHGFTAAHRTLPFGTCLVVRNLANGREVRVRVNDRGPYAKGRIIDVSEQAARELRMMDSGVVRARISKCQ